jgi:hypothetical protein
MKDIEFGNCLETSYNYLSDYLIGKRNRAYLNELPRELRLMLGSFGEPKMAQGIVWNDETKWHLHAWMEDETFCYDFANGNSAVVPKERYYEISKIKKAKTYSIEQMVEKVHQTKMIDFWDFKKMKVYKQNSVTTLS